MSFPHHATFVIHDGSDGWNIQIMLRKLVWCLE